MDATSFSLVSDLELANSITALLSDTNSAHVDQKVMYCVLDQLHLLVLTSPAKPTLFTLAILEPLRPLGEGISKKSHVGTSFTDSP